MKAFVIMVMAIFVLVATLAGGIYMVGGFTKEGMAKLLGIEPAKVEKPAEPASAEQIPELVKALKERATELDERDAALRTEEKRVQETRAQLEELRATLQQLVAEATKSLDKADADKQARLENVALSLGSMKPASAAEAIADWPPEDSAMMLQMIEDRARGKILDAMQPDKAAAILKAMQDVDAPKAAEGQPAP